MRRDPTRRSLAGLALLAPVAAAAQEVWPRRPLRMVVPYSAGGMTDTVARMLADRLGVALGQPVVVENRPGLAGTIGMDVVAKAPPDGHTIGMGTTNQTINETLQPRRPFRLLEDLVPVAMVDSVPFALAVSNALPVRNLAEFIAHAAAHPGALNYASSGPGSALHLAMERLARQAGIQLQHIPFRNYAEARTALMAGQIQAMFDGSFTLAPLIRAGQIRGLATGGLKRDPQLPELPTLAETWPGFEAGLWNGLFGPAGMPGPVVVRLHAEVNRILAEPAVIDAQAALGAVGLPMSQPAFRDLVAAEMQRHAELVRATGVQPD
ncbi:tripartite tricarboxylate transporter substrate binding protein [Belnapia sp. T6]|uniref:Tripartite tricarboxylate transporter substrate binding protein n=1 Tax=Belnapia mucosa TaxID=2804532 RepID=A0ABS1V185_9PROT|nr:tripartite tricarboxylate transporter substrate binding protein [Belnapia mucosa]MBL6454058.1 tripartite tricarboxylate transporter substrate binding protein [Belnapia mucosa]